MSYWDKSFVGLTPENNFLSTAYEKNVLCTGNYKIPVVPTKLIILVAK